MLRKTACFVVSALLAWTSPSSAQQTFDAGSAHSSFAAPPTLSVTVECVSGVAHLHNQELLGRVSLQANCAPAGPAPCAGPQRLGFTIYARDGRALGADQITITPNQRLHYKDEASFTIGHAALADISRIGFGMICPVEERPATPGGFCIEQTQWAVNFSYDNPLENRILTRGVSYYLEFADNVVPRTEAQKDAIRREVREIVAAGMMTWFSALQDNAQALDPAVAAYLGSLISRSSSHYSLMVPPQVVAMDCPDAALFVVRIYDQTQEGPFAQTRRAGRVKAALSQTPGRTIALNFDHQCWRDSYQDNVFWIASPEGRCVNGVPLLAHELGHAFGLEHVDEPDSIMRAEVRVTKPSRNDVVRLSTLLRQSIEGGHAGELTFVGSNGVEIDCATVFDRLLERLHHGRGRDSARPLPVHCPR